MDKLEFDKIYGSLGVKSIVAVKCLCGRAKEIVKEKALENMEINGHYSCMSCSQKKSHAENPRNKESHQKTSDALKGIKRSDETKKKMSEAKILFYQTEEGIRNKQYLSRLAAIQNSKFNLKGFHKRGFFRSEKLQKEFYYASSYELRAIYLLDIDENVISFETQIPICVNERGRCMDILVKYKDRSKILEVKPACKLSDPDVINQINDIKSHALENNCEFSVWSEENSGFKTAKEILLWAEEYLFKHQNLDLASIRKKKAAQRTMNYYEKHIKNDTVAFYCEFCKKEHTALRVTYDKNIARNGRYICEKEGGKIAGSKPKTSLHYFNPHAADGKKQCNGLCGQIKPITDFGIDKNKQDGHATICKECRRNKANENYRNKI